VIGIAIIVAIPSSAAIKVCFEFICRIPRERVQSINDANGQLCRAVLIYGSNAIGMHDYG
jgi:hypothetical protein